MLEKIKIVFVGRGRMAYTLASGERAYFYKDKVKDVSKEDGEKLLLLRGKGCRCHNDEGRLLFITYAQWKEYY